MNRDRLEALLWERIDGTINNEDLTELESVLAEHPEPRHLESEIDRLAEDLGRLQRVAPPGELRSRIGDALVGASPPAPATRKANPVHGLRPAAGASHRWLPLAACLLVGVAVGYLLPRINGGAFDENGVTGTMGATAAAARHTTELGDGLGTLTVTGDSAAVTIELAVSSSEEVVLTVEQPGGELAVSSFDESGGPSSDLSVSGGTVVLRTRGNGRYALGVTGADVPAPLHITVTAGGSVIAQRTLEGRTSEGRL